MYSYELDFLIKKNNSNLSNADGLFVTDISKNPQINHIKYNPYDDTTLIETSDGYRWTVTIQNK